MSCRTQNTATSTDGQSTVVSTLQGLSASDIRLILCNYTNKHPTYRKSSVREMNFKKITASQIFYLQLEFYRQKRYFSKEEEPITRENMKKDKYSPKNKLSSVWEYRLSPEKRVGNDSKNFDVGTRFFCKCRDCDGCGQIKCPLCGGTTRRDCYCCRGKREVPTRIIYLSGEYGGTEMRTCPECHGSGKATCGCSASGFITCFRCQGKLFLRHLNVLHVVTKYEAVEHYSEHEELEEQRVNKVSGTVILYRSHKGPNFQIQYPRGCEELKIKSEQIINGKRLTETPEEKIVEYRHKIEKIPFVKVNYEYRGRDKHFYIYGNENKVYFPDGFPQCYVNCCTVM